MWKQLDDLDFADDLLSHKHQHMQEKTSELTRQALTWNPQGKRKRGRPKKSTRRDLITDIEEVGYSWGEIERMAQDRRRWRRK